MNPADRDKLAALVKWLGPAGQAELFDILRISMGAEAWAKLVRAQPRHAAKEPADTPWRPATFKNGRFPRQPGSRRRFVGFVLEVRKHGPAAWVATLDGRPIYGPDPAPYSDAMTVYCRNEADAQRRAENFAKTGRKLKAAEGNR